MKRIIECVAAIAATLMLTPAAFAQSVQQQAADATAKTQSALAATGLPLWAWIVIAAVVLLLLIALIARRRRPTQAIIKTRLG